MYLETFLGSKEFTIDDQNYFSLLSGDYNPVHIDRQFARRSLFGEVVVHGVHSLIWTLDQFFREFPDYYLEGVEVNFTNPIFLDSTVKIHLQSFENNSAEISLTSNRKQVSKVTLLLNKNRNLENKNRILDSFPPEELYNDLSPNEILGSHGKISFFLPLRALEKKFNFISKNLTSIQIAALLSTSRLVGMKCPGLNSLFTSLSLKFSNCFTARSVSFKVSKYYERFNLINISLDSDSFSGSIKAFQRPPLIDKVDVSKLQKLITPNEFDKKVALVIGGSRGLGEIVAKIISLGGGKTIITYNQGIDDARLIVKDIETLGFESSYTYLNVLDSDLKLPNGNVTDIYYFASPRIKSSKDEFDENLYSYYNSFFCEAAKNIIIKANEKYDANLLYFYPSSIFVDEKPDEFKEYTRSKMKGELMLKKLTSSYPNMKVVCPRLPRLKTDQSQSLISVESEKPIPIILSLLRG